jgi:hypothetical protein
MSRKTAFNYDGLKEWAKELHRPFLTFYALAPANDPFIADKPGRREAAEWAAKIWRKLGVKAGAHVRRVFYLMVSEEEAQSFKMLNGKNFLNTKECWDALCLALRDARYLNLISADDMVDRRSDEPVIYRPDDDLEADAGIEIESGGFTAGDIELALPQLTLIKPVIPQPYQLEIWCEKTTVNDILLPIGEEFGVNIVTGTGELSHTRCVQLVRRAAAGGRPVRILYVSDFDPAGMSMPVAVGRKIEFVLRNENIDADIQVRPIALTHDQCVEFRLPRTPIKASERRAERFEERFGEGATELDALEARRPGELRRMLIAEIERYYDGNLSQEIEDIAEDTQGDLDRITAEVRRRYAKDIAALEKDREKIAALIKAAEKKAQPILKKIERDLDAAETPLPDWPEPRDGDEDEDPLFDSTRDYVEQMDRYKEHQGKATGRKISICICEWCGREYEAERSNSRTCPEHRRMYRYLPGGSRAGTKSPSVQPTKQRQQ